MVYSIFSSLFMILDPILQKIVVGQNFNYDECIYRMSCDFDQEITAKRLHVPSPAK